jgi:hypothetical protein
VADKLVAGFSMEPAMRYVKGHGLQTRSRIVENASMACVKTVPTA